MKDFLLSRRSVLKLIGASGVFLYLTPSRHVWASSAKHDLKNISPIDRSLPDKAAEIFFADDPQLAHKILWDKASYIKSLANGKLPEAKQKVPLLIIGGGMSGLASAYLLRKHQPVILEQSARFGGNSKGQSWRGIDYSIGAAYIVEPEPDSAIAKLLREIGVDKLAKTKAGEDPVALAGKIYQNFWKAETSPEDKNQFQILSKYFQDLFDGSLPFPEIPITDVSQSAYIKKLDEKSFYEHLQEKVGGKLNPHIETAIEQYCWSSFGASSLEISAAAGLNFYAAEFGNLQVFPGGNAAITESFLTNLSKSIPHNNLRTSCLVFNVKTTKDGTDVAFVNAKGEVEVINAGVVVMSCPKFVVKRVLEDIEPERVAAISKLRYHSYLVANVMLEGLPENKFYDLYTLGDGTLNTKSLITESKRKKVTDVIQATYAKLDQKHTVLTLYRGIPYDGARVELYLPTAYEQYKADFKNQLNQEILPLLKLEQKQVVDLRIARWGHPLPVAAKGLFTDGTLDIIRRPFGDKIFFVEQDNWALPAFETAIGEALHWQKPIEEALGALRN